VPLVTIHFMRMPWASVVCSSKFKNMLYAYLLVFTNHYYFLFSSVFGFRNRIKIARSNSRMGQIGQRVLGSQQQNPLVSTLMILWLRAKQHFYSFVNTLQMPGGSSEGQSELTVTSRITDSYSLICISQYYSISISKLGMVLFMN
jgi:hypothetical protein